MLQVLGQPRICGEFQTILDYGAEPYFKRIRRRRRGKKKEVRARGTTTTRIRGRVTKSGQHSTWSPSLLRSLPSVSLASLWIMPSGRESGQRLMKRIRAEGSKQWQGAFLPSRGSSQALRDRSTQRWFSETDLLITSLPIHCPESLS